MKRVIFGVFLAMGSGCECLAADKADFRVAEVIDWSGPFFGGHFGYVGGGSQFSSGGPGISPSSGSLTLFNLDPFKGTGSYSIGLSGGYDYMLPSRVVLGVELDVSFPNTIADSATIPGAQAPLTIKEAVQT